MGKCGSAKTRILSRFTQFMTVALLLKDKMEKENRLLKRKKWKSKPITRKWIKREKEII